MAYSLSPVRTALAWLLCEPPTDRALAGWRPDVYPLTLPPFSTDMRTALSSYVSLYDSDYEDPEGASARRLAAGLTPIDRSIP